MIRSTRSFNLSVLTCSGDTEPISLCEKWGGRVQASEDASECTLPAVCECVVLAAPRQTGEPCLLPSSSLPWRAHPFTCFHCHLNVAGICPTSRSFCAGAGQRQRWKVLVPIFCGGMPCSPPPPNSGAGISHWMKNVCQED